MSAGVATGAGGSSAAPRVLLGVVLIAAAFAAAFVAGKAMGDDTEAAAFLVEPIQGEGGVRPLSRAMAEALNAVCASTGALLIADEVQSGLGRTGVPFYASVLGLKPDLMALGKALGAGVPVGAHTRAGLCGRDSQRARL